MITAGIVIVLLLSSLTYVMPAPATADTLPMVTTGNATDITLNSATLNGDLTGLGNSTSVAVSFEWGLTASYGNVTGSVTMGAAGTFSAPLFGLVPGTTYHFRAKAVAGIYTAYGGDVAFAAQPLPPSVTTGAPTNVGTRLATLNGNLASLGTASQVQVSFQWGLTLSYGNQTTPQTMSSPGPFSINVTVLSPDTAYHFRAVAVGDGTEYGLDSFFSTRRPASRAEISLSEALDADNVATVETTIASIVDQGTGETLPSSPVACYQATAVYDPNAMSMLAVRSGDSPFNSPVFLADNSAGQTNFAQGAPRGQDAPVTVAKLVPSLTGSALRTTDMYVGFDLICDPTGNEVAAPGAPQAMTFQRGDVNGDGVVNIVDPMFGAQYLVGGRSDIKLLNMASVHHDVGADKVDIVDCMYIAQYAVGTRDANFQLVTTPTPAPAPTPTPALGTGRIPTKDNFVLCQAPTANFGSDSRLMLQAWTVSDHMRTLLEFDVSDIASTATITSASLQLYYYGNVINNPAGLSVSAYKLVRTSWTENVSTWLTYNGTNGWTSAGGDYVTSGPSGSSAVFPSSYGWMTWDVTAVVQDAVQNVSGKVELILKFNNETPGINYAPVWYSKEYGNSALVPRLVVNHS
jgi:hypothetical protein